MPRDIWVLTGASTGIGRATATLLAERDITLVLCSRHEQRGRTVAESLADRPAEVRYLPVDLADMASVVTLATHIDHLPGRLHRIIHNAGIACPERAETVDGFERTLAVNCLAPYLLTARLAARLCADGGGVVWVASQIHAASLDPAALQAHAAYEGWDQYCVTKLLAIIYAALSATASGVPAVSLHPGVVETALLPALYAGRTATSGIHELPNALAARRGLRDRMVRFAQRVVQHREQRAAGSAGEPLDDAAQALVHAADRLAKVPSGTYFDVRAVRNPKPVAMNHDLAAAVRVETLRLLAPWLDKGGPGR